MKFLIQQTKRKVEHDFSKTLIEACKYREWILGRENKIIIKYSEKAIHGRKDEIAPVGSVEFVCDYLWENFRLHPKPKNIPCQLLARKYTKRTVFYGTEKDITSKLFVKSNDKIKGFTDIVEKAPEGNYQISEVIEIVSEWRVFVYKQKMVGLKNYSGDFWVFPDVSLIQEMIIRYSDAPVAYTLDVGINNENGTFVIEVHDFFSCGLYGFNDYRILPHMFWGWWQEFLRISL